MKFGIKQLPTLTKRAIDTECPAKSVGTNYEERSNFTWFGYHLLRRLLKFPNSSFRFIQIKLLKLRFPATNFTRNCFSLVP